MSFVQLFFNTLYEEALFLCQSRRQITSCLKKLTLLFYSYGYCYVQDHFYLQRHNGFMHILPSVIIEAPFCEYQKGVICTIFSLSFVTIITFPSKTLYQTFTARTRDFDKQTYHSSNIYIFLFLFLKKYPIGFYVVYFVNTFYSTN